MGNSSDQNLFRQVHRQVQDLKDKARKEHAEAVQRSHKAAEHEAHKEGFDRPASVLPEGEPQQGE